MDHPFAIGSRTGRQGSAGRRDRARRAGLPRWPDGKGTIFACGRRAINRPPSRCLWSAVAVGLTLLSACTVRLEFAEHRFAKGDLAAASMGLVAHKRWVDRRPDQAVPAAPPPQRGVGRRRGRMPEPDAAGDGGAGRAGMRLITLADDLALAGPNSLARLIASLPARGSVAPASGPAEIRLGTNPIASPGLAVGDPGPAPEKPAYQPGPTWIPKPRPLARREQALQRSAPLPPPARPSAKAEPGWPLG